MYAPLLASAMADAVARERRSVAAGHRQRAEVARRPVEAPASEVTLRLARASDAEQLERLAQLDGHTRWARRGGDAGDVLVAESGGEIVAARPLNGDDRAISDPFRPTAEVRALLDTRARQLAQHAQRRRTRRLVLSPLRLSGVR